MSPSERSCFLGPDLRLEADGHISAEPVLLQVAGSHRARRHDGRPDRTHRRARRQARSPLGGPRARPGAGRPAGPAWLAAARQRHWRLRGTAWLRPPRRADRARARRRRYRGRRRTAPPPSRPAFRAAAVRRARAGHRRRRWRAEPPARRAHPEVGQWIKDLAAGHSAFARQLAGRQNHFISREDPDYGHLGQAFLTEDSPSQDAILQPPKPQIPPSARVLERAQEDEMQMEAVH